MNENTVQNTNQFQPYYFLSEILGAKIILHGKKIGKLSDIIIKENGKVPIVTHFYVSRSFGNPSLIIPWENIRSLTVKEVNIDTEGLGKYEGVPCEDALLLKDYILDKKVLDIEDREVEVVYDVKLVLKNNKLYVSDVDLSKYGLLRRIGLKGVANFIYKLADRIKDETISWTYIQPLPTKIGAFKGNVKLKILKEKLSEIHPVDLADILEELDHEQRVTIFDKLDTDHASDVLEEIDPSVQRVLVPSLKKEKAAILIDEMTPGQAADVLAALPFSEADIILKLLDKEKAKKIRSILEKQEENILNFATSNFLKFSPDMTVKQALEEYQRIAKGKSVIMYIYVVDSQNKLRGIIDIKELLMADDETMLRDIMPTNIISLKPESTLKEASAMFTRYSFRAIPVTDDNDKIDGVVLYRDVMNLTHHFLE
jgi:CBS domain-containing protein/sporulation protein YlmC with PRC-barrel domain